eukprot:SAG31_NODE_1778_length_7297_cov_10.330786_5_plen_53_part_00
MAIWLIDDQDPEQIQRIKELEAVYEGNIAGEWISTIRSLCYDMGHGKFGNNC